MTERQPQVELIPWDHDSIEHVDRMYLQRLGCGWRSEEVRDKWTRLGRDGTKTLYWVVLRDDLDGRDEIMARHLAQNPKESTPIHDTAPTHWRQPRHPTGRAFVPVGHIALDLRPDQNRQLGLDDDDDDDDRIVWVAGLYISYAVQAGGLGRDVMRLAEAAAAAPPLAARWVVLDTMSREQQLSGAFVRRVYLAQGKPAPEVAIQDWYERQGYEVFEKWTAGYRWVNPETGEAEDIDYLFLRKRLR